MATRPQPSHVIPLPGVGERLACTDTDGGTLSVVRHRNGRVELHRPGAPPVELDPATARSVGAFITGHYVLDPALATRLAEVLGGITFDWCASTPTTPPWAGPSTTWPSAGAQA